jgi:hypothetical protein
MGLFLAFLIHTAAPASGKIPLSHLSPRIANYTIVVVLDTSDKILSGREELTWHNLSPDTIPDLRFHLYLNAFKSSNPGAGTAATHIARTARGGSR